MTWTELDSTLSRVPVNGRLFVVADSNSNAKAGVRRGEKYREIVGAYLRDS